MLHLVTGGARSGKSRFAHEQVLKLTEIPVYVATAKRWDEEFEQRIKRHESERGEEWSLIEEEQFPSRKVGEGEVVMIDCVTLWLTNLFSEYKQDIDKCLEHFKAEVDLMSEKEATIFLITNEIGMGVHAESQVGRKFTDLQGWANQYAAQKAERVTFLVSGIPMKVK